MPLLLFGCAGQRAPEGGPVDTTPPEVISVSPAPYTVLFDKQSIIFEFSEYVDRRSVEESIFISPSIEGIEFDWSGTEVEMSFTERLRSNTTYVVTIGTDVVDVRARNRMAEAFTLPFSTGAKIDNGSITGKVFDDSPDGILIYAYKLDSILVDTLNPSKVKPDYLTQTGKNGEFSLNNLAYGTYRLIAVRDEYRNLLYDVQIDAAGTTEDVVLTSSDTLKTGISFIAAKTDTTPPTLVDVTSTDDRHVKVRFSEPLDSASVSDGSFLITDTLGRNRLGVVKYFPLSKTFDAFMLVTESQQKHQLYLMTVRAVRDKSGFVINPSAASKSFTASTVKDTIPPQLAGSSAGSPQSKIFPSDKILVSFTDALKQPVSDSSVILRRSKDSSQIPVSLTMNDPSSLYLVPKKNLPAGEKLQLIVRPQTLADLSGNISNDSSMVISFSVEDPENYGSISGTTAGYLPANTVVTAKNISDKKQPEILKAADNDGAFILSMLPEGYYALKMFEDRNNNKEHDAGNVFPYIRGERFVMYKDTIRVRARWPVDGVKMIAK